MWADRRLRRDSLLVTAFVELHSPACPVNAPSCLPSALTCLEMGPSNMILRFKLSSMFEATSRILTHGRIAVELYPAALRARSASVAGELADKQAEHEKEKKAHINTDKVQLQQGEAVDRYPQ